MKGMKRELNLWQRAAWGSPEIAGLLRRGGFRAQAGNSGGRIGAFAAANEIVHRSWWERAEEMNSPIRRGVFRSRNGRPEADSAPGAQPASASTTPLGCWGNCFPRTSIRRAAGGRIPFLARRGGRETPNYQAAAEAYGLGGEQFSPIRSALCCGRGAAVTVKARWPAPS